MASTVMTYRFGRFEVRPAQRSLLVDGAAASIGARAFDMLVTLIERRDRVVSGDELFELVWPGLVVEENNVRQQVAALRKLLGVEAVVTVPGRGYRLALALDAEEATPPAPDKRAVPSNLPLNLPALIGREAELPTVVELLSGAPLLTLVGAGGVGKARFALEVADKVRGAYKDGVWFVELAPVADPALVPLVVASVLGVHEEPGRGLLDTLLDFLRHRELLIVLDNCEHLVEACARWAEKVLHTSAGTRTLATSREALGIAGERTWRVPSLSAADPNANPSDVQLMAYAATQLFVQRAVAAAPAFRLTPGNAAAVAQVCHQLDGIPLALELAAARVKAMRVEQVAERLRDRFALLTRGSRTALERHQTLRSLIDWSHDLLSDPERVLLRRLSVFAGGWTLEAAEAVCSGEGPATADVLDLLTHLVEKSLVVHDDQAAEPRYRTLETIRQYGLEKLIASGEADAIRTRHLRHLVDFAEGVRTRLNGPDQVRWHGRVETELDNMRVGLNWSLQPANAELGLRLVNALHRHWYKNMHWGEMVGWQDRLAERCEREGRPPTLHLARSFYVAGMLATNFHPPTGRRLCEACVSLSRPLAFHEGMAWALMWIGHIDTRKRDPGTAELFAESVRAGRRIEDPWRQAFLFGNCLICYANYEALMGRDESAEAMVRECEAEIAKIGGDAIYLGHCRALLATIATRRGELERASKLVAESLALHRAVDSKFDLAGGLAQQGLLALSQGDPARALQLFRESLPLHRNYPMSQWATKGLAHLVIGYAACERWPIAAQLAGVLASTDGASTAAPPELSGRVARAYEEAVVRTRSALGEPGFEDEADAGRRMTREQAIVLALAETDSSSGG
jgi:non-specific serine/threonine protein kinase